MTDDEILAGVLRRFLADEENYAGTNGNWTDGDLILDGHVYLSPGEGEVIFRILHGNES